MAAFLPPYLSSVALCLCACLLYVKSKRMDYCPFYCEENVWRLLSGREYPGGRAWALFVFGRDGRAAVFNQRAGHGPFGLVLWDYHAVALVDGGRDGPRVLDFDSSLGFDSPAAGWLRRSLLPPADFPPEALESIAGCEPLVRLLPGAEFVRRFRSDRSHMRAPDGSWLQPPPPWPHPGSGREPGPDGDWELGRLIDPRWTGPAEPVGAGRFLSILEVGRTTQPA